MAIQGLMITPYTMTEPPTAKVTGMLKGALVVEGDHLEPTTGQIWPR